MLIVSVILTTLFSFGVSEFKSHPFHLRSGKDAGAAVQQFDTVLRSGVVGGFVTSWSWDFGDGSAASCTSPDLSCENPAHVFAQSGTYVVRLEPDFGYDVPRDANGFAIGFTVTLTSGAPNATGVNLPEFVSSVPNS